MQVICWGSRGSVPRPLGPAEVTMKIARALEHLLAHFAPIDRGVDSVRIAQHLQRHIGRHNRALLSTYGGNTPCVEVRGVPDVTLVFDLGTGFRTLSQDLLRASESGGRQLVVFLSHLHFDHLLGLPLALLAYQPDTTIQIYGAHRDDGAVSRFLTDVQAPPFFPVPLEKMGATFEFNDFRCDVDQAVWSHDVPDGMLEVRACPINHPNGCVSYRVDGPDSSFVYCTDREGGKWPDERFVAFSRGSDLLIHDAQFTPDQYEGRDGPPRRGWGHSTFAMAVDAALDSGVRRLALFHHDPDHTDEQIDQMGTQATEYMAEAADRRGLEPVPVDIAYDGMVWVV